MFYLVRFRMKSDQAILQRLRSGVSIDWGGEMRLVSVWFFFKISQTNQHRVSRIYNRKLLQITVLWSLNTFLNAD